VTIEHDSDIADGDYDAKSFIDWGKSKKWLPQPVAYHV
jgi:hypothetical protein